MPDPQGQPIVVDVPGVGSVEFPAGTSEETMQQALQQTHAQAQQTNDPSVWERLKSAAYQASPLPLFEKQNLPGTLATVAGTATGGLAAIPVAAATGVLTRAATGGTPAQNFTEGAIQGATQAVGPALSAAKEVGPWMMQKALKPTASMLKEYRTTAPQLVKTLLDEGINVTQGGLDKLQRLFDANNKDISSAISDREALLQRLGIGADVVDKNRVAARTLTTANRLAQQTNPTKDLQAVADTVTEFQNHPTMPGNLTLTEAQKMKIGTYQQIGKKYGQISSAEVEAQKGLARGLKEEIAAEVPQISALNERDSRLMAALDAVGRRVALSGNHDPVGFAWVAHSPVSFLAALIDRNPTVKSLIARGLYKQADYAGRVAPGMIRTALAAIAQQPSPSPDAPPPQE
jgi:hypothetical protein